jgi:plastocyanin
MLAQDYRKALVRLNPGDGVTFKHEDAQPHARIAYQRINAVAHRMWGAGAYRLRSGCGETTVLRLREHPPAASAREARQTLETET